MGVLIVRSSVLKFGKCLQVEDTTKLDYEAGDEGEGNEKGEAPQEAKEAEGKDGKEEPATDELEEEAEGEAINEETADAFEDRQNAKPQVNSFGCKPQQPC